MSEPAAPPAEVRVVCPTHRRPQLLPRLVAALEAQTFPADRMEVCIVDDGSGDSTREVLLALAAASPLRITVLSDTESHGPARARNRGWRTSDAPLLAFTDDDCTPAPDWVERGLAALTADDRIGVVQGAVRVPDDARPTAWSIGRELDGPTPFFEGCNVFYRREALAAAGGFSEQIGWYGEDAEAGWSVVDGGWDRRFAGDAVVVHDVAPRSLWWHIRNGYLERNLIGVGKRHPQFAREAYWRRRVWKPHVAACTLGVFGTGLALVVWGWAPLLLWLPWAALRLPRRGYRSHPWLGLQRLAVDAAQAAGHLAGSLRHRTLVL